jgi:hypothetical protein
MSDIVIKSNSNQFEVNTAKGTRTGEYKDGEVRLTDGKPVNNGAPIRRAFEQSQYGAEVRGDGSVHVEYPMQVTSAKAADPKSTDIMSTLQDTAGRKCFDARQAIASPEKYTVAIAGTRVAFDVAMRLGFASIDGSGSVEVDHGAIAQDLNPKPAAIQEKSGSNDFWIHNPALDAFKSDVCQPLGVSPENFFASAIGNGKAAAEALAQQIPGTDPGYVQEIMVDMVNSHIENVATLLEAHQLVPAGQGEDAVKWAFDTCDPKVGKRLLHGTLAGSRSTFEEIAHRFANKERF